MASLTNNQNTVTGDATRNGIHVLQLKEQTLRDPPSVPA